MQKTVEGFTRVPAVQPGEVITASLMNEVLARLDNLDQRVLDVRIIPTPLLTGTHSLVALGGAFGQPGGIWLNDSPILPAVPAPGINLAILSTALTVKFSSAYSTGALAAESQRLVADLQTFGASSDIVVGITQDAFTDQLQSSARTALATIGCTAFTHATARDAIAFIGVIPMTSTLNFDYLVSDVPVDGQGAGLPFVWAVYSTSLQRFLAGGGTGGGGLGLSSVGITSLRFDPPTPTAGASTTATLTLGGPAPDDLVVTLGTGSPQIASLPQATVAVARGRNSAQFQVAAVAPGQVSISAALPNQTPFSVGLSVQAPPAALSVIQVGLNPNPTLAGATVTGTVTLSSAAPVGTVVTVSSGNTSVAVVQQPTVPVTQGQSTVQFQVSAANPGTTDIRATLGASSQIATLTVQKPKDTKEKEKDTKEQKDNKDKDTKESFREKLTDKVQAEKLASREQVQLQQRVLTPGGPNMLLPDAPTATGQAFIRPAERPAVGQQALNQPVGPG